MTAKDVIMLALKASILATVFGFGLKTALDDLLYLWRRPGLLARSLFAIFIGMPLVALLLVRGFELSTNVKIALVALSIAPLPPMIPGKVDKADGRADYAISLLATLALLSVLFTPLAVFLLGHYFGLPFAMAPRTVAMGVGQSILLPLVLGTLIRAFLPMVAALIEGPVVLFGKVLLPLAALAILAGSVSALWALIGSGTLIAMAAFVSAGLLLGHLLGGADGHERAVLALSTASRHPAVALSIAAAGFPEERMGATILLYLLVNIILGVPYANWQRRKPATS